MKRRHEETATVRYYVREEPGAPTEIHEATVTVAIDLDAVVQRIGVRAARNQSGRATAYHELITARERASRRVGVELDKPIDDHPREDPHAD